MTAEGGALRALVSDWQANGNSRELDDPRADVWQECARQLLTVLDAAARSQHPEDREGVGTGAGEGATGQDTGTAWVTRSTDSSTSRPRST
ncbi:hypothetical protein NSZ01_16350 [Nocardioides szechwanensis]|uniref:Uncharacterized protein n=1 Tax=Nocardioides szechwanensis TaxID=1005944 RepID=A0A1G9Z9T7_9ACTN|nr:hypothetical protein NSZ01_16350 [Nocardioides szechwanensis]SDN18130.1 hypothetical protein SAMN05192576_1661 [Nocardioides szechwanensis]